MSDFWTNLWSSVTKAWKQEEKEQTQMASEIHQKQESSKAVVAARSTVPITGDPCKAFLPSMPKPECLDKMWQEAGCTLPYDDNWVRWAQSTRATKEEMEKLPKQSQCYIPAAMAVDQYEFDV
jgi:hypothetical protein